MTYLVTDILIVLMVLTQAIFVGMAIYAFLNGTPTVLYGGLNLWLTVMIILIVRFENAY
jgi:hypothetical protein